ncbi:MAG TPA: FRG domain-containing protein [Victivallales bacterium]|nr:FRG domain-containing protein [Victivallales bacterium]
MNEIIIKTWSELQNALFDYEIGLTAPGRYRSPYAYRGLPENYPKMKTSLMRIGGPYIELESSILRNFKKYADLADINTENEDSEWLWLALAQHYGLPTRLLDWTYSPYVALHFATADTRKSDQDGVIWCVNYQKAREFLPDKLKFAIHDQGFKFTVNSLNKGAVSLKQLEQLDKELGDSFVIFIEPPSLDSRIVNQYALFSMMSSSSSLLDNWLEKNDHKKNLYTKIIIPSKLKWQIRDHLDQANINERMLFPGLDGLCQWLKRYYSSKDKY